MKIKAPLKFSIHVPLVFYPFPIHFLRIAPTDFSDRSISRVLNSLQEGDFITIGDVLNTSIIELVNTRNFGEKGLYMLCGMLETISHNPELILDTDNLKPPLRNEVECLKQKKPVKNQLLDLGIKL
ncbi:DNA-directed RNA polymerase subunit alpha C-terminal domain-containing protein [Paenibacillus typhae]|uniref:RNA polymerase, alpha chain C terminal domain n=1 Tax=Paenibacillus typhae TaxID=1174501 RepID=A0A1G9AZX7_9BACL|nr:RNA polymerase, alpha chain C terminal domain [Paenibacillus typhae]